MKYYAGIDVGSLSADAVIIDENGNMAGYAVVPTGHDSRASGSRAYTLALEKAGIAENDVAGSCSTGYSRDRVLEAGAMKTEISCHAKGAKSLFENANTVIDIGGQDSKAIRLGDNGRVLDFAMNDKCAAGTGRFLEVMAKTLNVPLENLGDMALESGEHITISSTCTVFGESEVVSLISVGKAPRDIAAAVCRSIAHRASALASRVGVSEEVIMTGGVAKNTAVLKALSSELGITIKRPEEPQITGALGAALFALDGNG